MEQVSLILGLIVTSGAAAVVLTKVWRRLTRIRDRVENFLDDWAGTDERPGVPARPGVMARLASHDEDLKTVRSQVLPNGGTSMRDQVGRIEDTLAQHIRDHADQRRLAP